jgi:hypothetical protein
MMEKQPCLSHIAFLKIFSQICHLAVFYFTTVYGVRSPCTLTGSELVPWGPEADYFLWRHQSAVSIAPKGEVESKRLNCLRAFSVN